MRFKEIIKIADQAYGDGLIQDCFNAPKKNHGDGLAAFIVEELTETYDQRAGTKQQLSEACRVMENATEQLNEVYDAFAKAASRG